MPGIAKVGDLCSCYCKCHGKKTIGVSVNGANSVLTNGSPTARLGDMFMCDCGHPTFVVSSSSTVSAEGILVARLGDSVAACPVGTIITSSNDVNNAQ